MESAQNELSVVLRGLRKSFGDQTVLNGIDLTVAPGETLAVLGRSGSGKSVLLKLIIGLQKPDAGSIRIHGREITELAFGKLNQVRKKVGFLFQDGALYDSLTLEENVAFPLRRHNRMPAAEQKNRARDLLTQVGMEQTRDMRKLPSQISGGMKKRVGLARALVMDPDIMLLDEPTSGLDPITAGEIEELILRLQETHRMASILVTHDLHGAQTVSNRVSLLHEGAILAEGTFEELHRSKEPFVSKFLRGDA
jgi:phospholipid/cholesterol/gamma-HCH transport system ATP-binding protein